MELKRSGDSKVFEETIYLGNLKIATFTDGSIQYLHSDGLGVEHVMTNAKGVIVGEAVYEPFGAPVMLGSMHSRFPGQFADKESGYSYNYFRDYDPSVGRYLQSDPIGLEGGINLYVYALNSPTNLVDLFGLQPFQQPFSNLGMQRNLVAEFIRKRRYFLGDRGM